MELEKRHRQIPELIVMLTNNDETVGDALDAFRSAMDLPVKAWGFKDVGLPPKEMGALVDAMKQAGKSVYLEVTRPPFLVPDSMLVRMPLQR